MNLDQRLRSASDEVREMATDVATPAPAKHTLLSRFRTIVLSSIAAVAVTIAVVGTVLLVPRGDDFVEKTTTTVLPATTTTEPTAGLAQIEVPFLIGEPADEAVLLLESLGLAPAIDHGFHEDVPEGLVMGTEPAPGTPLEEGSLITLIVSDGPEPTSGPIVPGVPQAASFPNQVAVPATVFLGGTVYDLSQVPPRVIASSDQYALPYEADPVLTQHGLVMAIGSGYDATLTLFPDSGDPVVFAEHVGSFVVSPDQEKIAWTEPWPEEIRDVVSPTRVVEASFPSGEILRESVFTGFDIEGLPTFGSGSVDGYIGHNVLMMTGDGAVATAAVWVPDQDLFVRAVGYSTHAYANTSGDRAVLSQDAGFCGIVVTVGSDGRVDPPNGWEVPYQIDCWAGQAATFSPNGSAIASAGNDGDQGPPVLLLSDREGNELSRIALDDLPGAFFRPAGIQWLDNDNLLLFTESWDERSESDPHSGFWDVFECTDGLSACRHLQSIKFDPTDYSQVALVKRPGD